MSPNNPHASSDAMSITLNSNATNPSTSTDLDQEASEQALIDATRIVLNDRFGLSIASLLLDPCDPVSTVDYRPSWLMIENPCEHDPVVQDVTTSLIEHAVSLVANGHQPSNTTRTKPTDDDKKI